MNKLQDIEIINKVMSGDINAFRFIIDKYKISCFNLALRILSNREDAEECISDAFMNAFKNLSRYTEQTKLKAWLLKIVYNRAISMKRKKKIPAIDIETNEHLMNDFEISDAEKILNNEDNKKIITYALNKLDDESRAIVNLFYYEEAGIDEISIIMNLKHNTVKSKLFRARQQMYFYVNRFYLYNKSKMVE